MTESLPPEPPGMPWWGVMLLAMTPFLLILAVAVATVIASRARR